VFLCLYHVMKAWLENIRRKLSAKSRVTEALEMLKKIVYWRKPGASEDERRSGIDRLVDEFKETFRAEGKLLQYFDSYWVPKKGGSPVSFPHFYKQALS
jgi:hypothetical protein